MSTRPITDSELKTLQSMSDQGDMELSLKEITYRNRQFAEAMPLLLEKIATLREKLESDTRRLREALKPFANSDWRMQVDQNEPLTIRRVVRADDRQEFTAGDLQRAHDVLAQYKEPA